MFFFLKEEHQTITGIEFRWPKIREKLKLPYKKMNGKLT